MSKEAYLMNTYFAVLSYCLFCFSTNLSIVMSSLTQIARLRPGFMPRVLQGLESLQVNMPPSLTTSQVSLHTGPRVYIPVL